MSEFQLRPLTGQDTFKLLSILNQLEVGDLFGGMIKDVSDVKMAEQMVKSQGSGIVSKLIKSLTNNLPNMKDEINELLADLYQTDLDTIINLSFNEYLQLIVEFFKHDDFKDFLKYFSSLSK